MNFPFEYLLKSRTYCFRTMLWIQPIDWPIILV